ncbi:DUF881 domain-containing protein [Luteococcus sediminum]|uniref:DUF881 domain-containing protein n=1 Tax=Luteococcus sp. TaxID=1969402 RepID=UPI0037364A1E
MPEPEQVDPSESGASPRRPAGRSSLRERYPAWDRILHDFFRPGAGQLLMALALSLLGFLMVAQVHQRAGADSYASMRRTDLVQLLDQLTAEQGRLAQEASQLERTQQQLASGADARRIAEREKARRVAELGILNGTLPAVGPGVRIVINDPGHGLTPEIVLDAVEELRDAGAEAIEVNDAQRVVAQTWFGSGDDLLLVNGHPVRTPLVLDVIGDPHSLEEGARFRGGLVSQVQAEAVGGQVQIQRLQEVRIDSLFTPPTPQFARPA